MKLLAGLFALMLAIGFTALWLWRCFPEPAPCESRDLAQSRSPDGRSEAEVFELRCGASVTTHVALRPAMSSPRARADVFIAEGTAPVRLTWNSARELVVESPSTRVLVAETRWRDVGVRIRQGTP